MTGPREAWNRTMRSPTIVVGAATMPGAEPSPYGRSIAPGGHRERPTRQP